MGGLIDVIGSNVQRLFKVVGLSAPLLAGALGSPFAGMAISLLGNLFGVPNGNVEDILEKIKLDPDATTKLKQLELEHSEALAKIQSTNYSTEVEDREDARKYSVLYKDFLRHMAYLVTGGFFGVLFLLFFPLEISAEEKNLLYMLIGMLVSKWQTIIDFFYGSSRHKQGELK